MTIKMSHKCKACEDGTYGVYIKVCKKTGLFIETFIQQQERITKDLLGNKNFK